MHFVRIALNVYDRVWLSFFVVENRAEQNLITTQLPASSNEQIKVPIVHSYEGMPMVLIVIGEFWRHVEAWNTHSLVLNWKFYSGNAGDIAKVPHF